MVTSTRSVRLAAMENEDNENRDVTVEVGTTLASVGGLGSENGPFQVEGLAPTGDITSGLKNNQGLFQNKQGRGRNSSSLYEFSFFLSFFHSFFPSFQLSCLPKILI